MRGKSQSSRLSLLRWVAAKELNPEQTWERIIYYFAFSPGVYMWNSSVVSFQKVRDHSFSVPKFGGKKRCVLFVASSTHLFVMFVISYLNTHDVCITTTPVLMKPGIVMQSCPDVQHLENVIDVPNGKSGDCDKPVLSLNIMKSRFQPICCGHHNC